MMEKNNIILDKSFIYAVRIVKFYQYLIQEKKEFVLSKQILRSGTSIGANVEEGVGGFTKKDFVAKMGIAYKEARETHYWLKLLFATDYIAEKEYHSLLQDCNELISILIAIIKSAKE